MGKVLPRRHRSQAPKGHDPGASSCRSLRLLQRGACSRHGCLPPVRQEEGEMLTFRSTCVQVRCNALACSTQHILPTSSVMGNCPGKSGRNIAAGLGTPIPQSKTAEQNASAFARGQHQPLFNAVPRVLNMTQGTCAAHERATDRGTAEHRNQKGGVRALRVPALS